MTALRPFAAAWIAAAAAAVLVGAAVGAEPATVVVFGDSLAAGNALPRGERANAWVPRVERLAASRLRIVNEGKPGRSLDSAAELEEALARAPRIDLLVLALGTNDSGDLVSGSVARATHRMRALIATARRRAVPLILLVGPPDISTVALAGAPAAAERRSRNLAELNQAFAGLASELDCRFVSLYATVSKASLARDGVHPDSSGNGAMARAMLPALLDAAAR